MSVGTIPPAVGYLHVSGSQRITVDEYHRMIDSGQLTEDDRVELLEGRLVPKMPQNRPHSLTCTRVEEAIRVACPAGWQRLSAKPISLPESEPEPDVSLVRDNWPALRVRHPEPPDVGLVIEIADTSLASDREVKGRAYAAASLPVYWIVNIAERQIEAYTDPRLTDPVPAYATRTDYRPGDAVPLILDGQTVAHVPVANLLG